MSLAWRPWTRPASGRTKRFVGKDKKAMSTPGVPNTEQLKEQVRQNWARQAAQWRKWTSQKEV